MYIKHSLKRAARVNTSSVFAEIVKVHKSALQQYMLLLAHNLPTAGYITSSSSVFSSSPSSSSPSSSSAPSLPPSLLAALSWSDADAIPLRLAELNTPSTMQALGVAVNTCEYCLETLPMLQQTLDALVGVSAADTDSAAVAVGSSPNPNLNSSSNQNKNGSPSELEAVRLAVSVSDETEACSLLLHKCVMHAVAVLSARLSRAWSKQMLAVDWAQLDAVGDVSAWMSAAIAAIKDGLVVFSGCLC